MIERNLMPREGGLEEHHCVELLKIFREKTKDSLKYRWKFCKELYNLRVSDKTVAEERKDVHQRKYM